MTITVRETRNPLKLLNSVKIFGGSVFNSYLCSESYRRNIQNKQL